MPRATSMELLQQHLASRCDIAIEQVHIRSVGEPSRPGPWELVTGTQPLDAFRAGVPEAEFVGWLNGPDGRRPLAIVRSAPPREPAPDWFRVIAVVPAYDEADILDRVIAHLVANGVEVHVIDNWSTDGCYEIAQSWLGRGVVAIDRFPESGPAAEFDWQEVLRRVPRIGAASGAHWTTLNDADEIRQSPWPGVTLRDALWHVECCGYNAVNLTLLDFLLTDDEVARDGLTADRSLEEAFPYVWPRPIGDLFQLKFWRNGDYDVEIASSGGHAAHFPGRRVFPYNFLQRHYPYRSRARATEKITSRLARQPKAERRLGWGNHLKPDAELSFPVPSEGAIPFDDAFAEDYLVERLTAIGWRIEIDPPTSLKHRVARVLRRLGLWQLYERRRSRPVGTSSPRRSTP